MSSLLEEFQDLDNFKLLEEQGGGNYTNHEKRPYDQEIEFDRPLDIYDQTRQYNSKQSPDEYYSNWEGNYDESRDDKPDQNYKNEPPFNQGAWPVEGDSKESVHFPQVALRNDIRARSEKYKSHLVNKLNKIRNEFNIRDSKIDSLLNKISTQS